ncbi:CBL-interacting serine/threonine-protein kinase 21 [Gossypium arboreum]|uniref:CBL-interacting serine/threonine-protein kinase 21 n=1 Tax=Gossypium arboreum TaxID=29729 RepID=A0A0B0PKS3_GOSAR|nr:CBL-interacting serine/threonine-protein kinase 21 [Gossypium arboreum]
MGLATTIGKYQLGRTIGEGTFAKVKLAVDTTNGHHVAIKIIDKAMVQSEIRTMKLLHHPNVVRIYEVIGSKTKIYIIMEYISGGQLSDKLSYAKKLSEPEGRKVFQQLIDAVDHCHGKGVYHRDLKPENLLLDSKGNLKVTDFGLSALRKPGDMLTTACGSPCYVAPELLANKGYDGAAADIWSCGVILFELLAGYLPFDDRNLVVLYKKISGAEYTCPPWFTGPQRKLIARILDPNPKRRITIPEIIEDAWFQTDYTPSCGYEYEGKIDLDDVSVTFDTVEDGKRQRTTIGSKHTVNETIKKIEAAAMDVSLSVERMNSFKMKIHPKQKMTRCCRSSYDLSAEVIVVAPTNCVVEISKSAGELAVYKEFCKSLSSLLIEKSDASSQIQGSKTITNSTTPKKKKTEQKTSEDISPHEDRVN